MINAVCPCLEKITRLFRPNKPLPPKHFSALDYTDRTNDSHPDSPTNNSNSHSPDFLSSFSGEHNKVVTIPPAFSRQAHPQNLTISRCISGRYHILNQIQNAYIDHCSDTFVFVGPCRSTVFIRNCKEMRIRAVCQQLRIENCQRVHIEAIVGVRPVLDNCKHITFSCLSVPVHDDLFPQMERAGINVLDNQVFECYDFTPSKPANFQNEPISTDMDPHWPTVLRDYKLVKEEPADRLPHRMAIKTSMIKRIFTEPYLHSNPNIMILQIRLASRRLLLQRLTAIGFQVICLLDSDLCEGMLLSGQEQRMDRIDRGDRGDKINKGDKGDKGDRRDRGDKIDRMQSQQMSVQVCTGVEYNFVLGKLEQKQDMQAGEGLELIRDSRLISSVLSTI